MTVWRWVNSLFHRFRVRVGLESPMRELEPPGPTQLSELVRQECEKARQRFESGALFGAIAEAASRRGNIRAGIVETRPGAPDVVHQLTIEPE